jgi:hypothetical protein
MFPEYHLRDQSNPDLDAKGNSCTTWADLQSSVTFEPLVGIQKTTDHQNRMAIDAHKQANGIGAGSDREDPKTRGGGQVGQRIGIARCGFIHSGDLNSRTYI